MRYIAFLGPLFFKLAIAFAGIEPLTCPGADFSCEDAKVQSCYQSSDSSNQSLKELKKSGVQIAAHVRGGHLSMARSLVDKVKTTNNRYELKKMIVWGQSYSDTQVITDCSGFVSTVLECSGSKVLSEMRDKLKFKNSHPRTSAFYEAIQKEIGFKRVVRVSDISPGDIVTINYLNSPKASVMGHIMIIDSVPARMNSKPPVISNTEQWEVEILDSAEGPHGTEDTRYSGFLRTNRSGIGRGKIRLYTDKQGLIVGYAKSTEVTASFVPVEKSPIEIGRPVY